MTINTNKLSTKRLVTMNGVHMGFVVVDEENQLVAIPSGEHKPYTEKAAFGFARSVLAMLCAIDKDVSGYISYEQAEIGTRYQVQDF